MSSLSSREAEAHLHLTGKSVREPRARSYGDSLVVPLLGYVVRRQSDDGTSYEGGRVIKMEEEARR